MIIFLPAYKVLHKESDVICALMCGALVLWQEEPTSDYEIMGLLGLSWA